VGREEVTDLGELDVQGHGAIMPVGRDSAAGRTTARPEDRAGRSAVLCRAGGAVFSGASDRQVS
jgi:hypothetical protein